LNYQIESNPKKRNKLGKKYKNRQKSRKNSRKKIKINKILKTVLLNVREKPEV
jgi:hypothetical protein